MIIYDIVVFISKLNSYKEKESHLSFSNYRKNIVLTKKYIEINMIFNDVFFSLSILLLSKNFQ
jgi:hypothetical protein